MKNKNKEMTIKELNFELIRSYGVKGIAQNRKKIRKEIARLKTKENEKNNG
jgi:ribosomal protein L29